MDVSSIKPSAVVQSNVGLYLVRSLNIARYILAVTKC